jgi:hypothetical protein
MAVFREITIPFAGKDYAVTPSNKVLRRIEMKARRDDPQFNLVAVFYRATSMAGGFYDLSFVLSELINSAGGNATEDDALAEFMGFNDPKELSAYVALICSCVMPEPSDKAKKETGAATETAT